MLSELCVFIATGVRGRIQQKGRVGTGWKKHSNRINLTERNGNAVRSWDRWTITVKCVCVSVAGGAGPVDGLYRQAHR